MIVWWSKRRRKHKNTHTYTQKLLNDCLKDINEVRGGEAQVQSSDLHQLWLIVPLPPTSKWSKIKFLTFWRKSVFSPIWCILNYVLLVKMIWFIFPTPNFPANFHPIYVFFMFLDSSQVLFGDRKVAEVNLTENSNFATKAKAEPIRVGKSWRKRIFDNNVFSDIKINLLQGV